MLLLIVTLFYLLVFVGLPAAAGFVIATPTPTWVDVTAVAYLVVWTLALFVIFFANGQDFMERQRQRRF